MATYGVYSKDHEGCYISGLSLEDAKRHLQGEDRILCLEKEETTGLEIALQFHKAWYWRLRPRLGYLELGFVALYWRKFKAIKPFKEVQP